MDIRKAVNIKASQITKPFREKIEGLLLQQSAQPLTRTLITGKPEHQRTGAGVHKVKGNSGTSPSEEARYPSDIVRERIITGNAPLTRKYLEQLKQHTRRFMYYVNGNSA